jgi:hypothetical protein
MTPTEFADKLRLQVAELVTKNVPLLIASTSTQSEIATRIFIRGEATASGKIGNYNNTTPLYLNPNNPKVFGMSRIGSPGKFKNGKEKKTVKTTYKGYKAFLDRPSGGAFVSLELTGDLKSDFTNNVSIGSKDILNRVSVNEYTCELSDINRLKAEGNEGRFGRDIFKLSNGEKDLFYKIAEFELRKIFS